MDEMSWYQYLSDDKLVSYIDLILQDYKLMVFLFGGTILDLLRRLAKKTKTKRDDVIVDRLESRIGGLLGLSKKEAE